MVNRVIWCMLRKGIYMNSNTKDKRSNGGTDNSKPKKSKIRIVIRVLCFILCAVLGLGLGAFIYVYRLMGAVGFVNTPFVSKDQYETIEFDNLDDVDLNSGDVASSWRKAAIHEYMSIRSTRSKKWHRRIARSKISLFSVSTLVVRMMLPAVRMLS